MKSLGGVSHTGTLFGGRTVAENVHALCSSKSGVNIQQLILSFGAMPSTGLITDAVDLDHWGKGEGTFSETSFH